MLGLSPVVLLAGSIEVFITDDDNKPLPDTVIYLSADNSDQKLDTGEINIEQKDKNFTPFVSVVNTGTTAFFPNRDGIGHHVYSFSPARTFQLPLSE